ncbi:hypothetical protein B0H10DRAFT_2233610 [Mycena sp. CBHHK59/15]|nr:hypothetical protein B0H10DRAFT_2233610 [Mycena sp. CBHHK59/15]
MNTSWKDIKGEIVLNATAKAKEGAAEELGMWLERLQANTKSEPGTLEYTFARNGDTFVTWERCADAAAFEEHLKGSLLQKFRKMNFLEYPHTPLFYTNIRGDVAK